MAELIEIERALTAWHRMDGRFSVENLGDRFVRLSYNKRHTLEALITTAPFGVVRRARISPARIPGWRVPAAASAARDRSHDVRFMSALAAARSQAARSARLARIRKL